jgi:signal transduction histidine kinase
MGHDLRNPLATMLSMLSALTWLDEEGQDTLSARQQRYIGQSIENVRQMNQLVSNILDVGRLESDQMPLHQSAVPVDALLSEIVEAQKPLAQAKQLSLQCQVPSTVPPAWADANLLERVVQNLLDNAIKFTPGGGRVLVTAQPWEENGSSGAAVQIAVSDTGPGVPPELEPHLFNKFAAGNQKGSGSGLGLAFCKLAVEAHGGKMWLEDQSGMGATFAFTLPIAQRTS